MSDTKAALTWLEQVQGIALDEAEAAAVGRRGAV